MPRNNSIYFLRMLCKRKHSTSAYAERAVTSDEAPPAGAPARMDDFASVSSV